MIMENILLNQVMKGTIHCTKLGYVSIKHVADIYTTSARYYILQHYSLSPR